MVPILPRSWIPSFIFSLLFVAGILQGQISERAISENYLHPADRANLQASAQVQNLTVTDGDGQTAFLLKELSSQFKLMVSDGNGDPAVNVPVVLKAPDTGPGGLFRSQYYSYITNTVTITTNINGIAVAPFFRANCQPGSFDITAGVAGSNISASISVTNSAQTVARLTATYGSNQSTTVNSAFPQTLTAVAWDAGDTPVSCLDVSFESPQTGPGATFNGASTYTVQTGQYGNADTSYPKANSGAGGYVVTARLSAFPAIAPASFYLTNTAGTAAVISATQGLTQTAIVSSTFLTAFKAQIKDNFGNTVSNTNVIFSSPQSGPGGSFNNAISITVKTDSSGLATASPFKANCQVGSYNVTATISGTTATSSYFLTNQKGNAAIQTTVSGMDQAIMVSTTTQTAFKTLVTDSCHNPLGGIPVNFVISNQSGSPGGTFENGNSSVQIATDEEGFATAPSFQANGVSGFYTVTANVPGIVSPAVFKLVNLPVDDTQNKSTSYQNNASHNNVTTIPGFNLPDHQLWTKDFEDPIDSSPLAAQGLVFVTTQNQDTRAFRLFAFDADSGNLVWGPLDAGYRTFYGVTSPTYYGGKLFLGSDDGMLTAYDAATGAVVWTRFIGANGFRPPLIAYKNVVYIVYGDLSRGQVLAVNADDGTIYNGPSNSDIKRDLNKVDELKNECYKKTIFVAVQSAGGPGTPGW